MRHIILLLSVCFFYGVALGQNTAVDSTRKKYDALYGLNNSLVNGKKNFPYYLDHHGHPFWNRGKPLLADLIIEGKRFQDQLVNYNIEQQDFILNYTDYNGGKKQLVLNAGNVDTIFIKDHVFVPNHNPKIKRAYLQFIYHNKIKCTKGWYKSLEVDKDANSRSGFKYQKEQTEWYLENEHKTVRFQNKKGFLAFFDKELRTQIKRYMNQKKVRFRSISDDEIKEVLIYSEQLYN